MKDLEELEECVRQLMEKTVQITVTPDRVNDDLHLDSMALLELIVGIEKEFGVNIDDAELDTLKHFRNVKSIAKFLFKHEQE